MVRQGEETRTFSRRGVADLYDLYATDRALLKGAWLADKSSERERQPDGIGRRVPRMDPGS